MLTPVPLPNLGDFQMSTALSSGATFGAIAGAVVGNNTEANSYSNQPQQVQEQAVQRCRNVDAYEERTNGYEVTYEYRGRNYTEIMRRDPGQRIRLRVSATPADN